MEVDSKTKALEVVSQLDSMDLEVRLKNVRMIKNTIIGNRTKKVLYRSIGTVGKLLDILSSDQNNSELVIQVLVSIGSFASGDSESVKLILAHPSLTIILNSLGNSDRRVLEAAARTIKLILQSLPTPRKQFVLDPYLSVLKNLLDYRSQGLIIAELAASIVARVCENNDQREKFAEMGGVEPIINLLLTSYPKTKEAALDAIASLSCLNPQVAGIIVNTKIPDRDITPLQLILDLVKDKRPKTRLFAATCITNLSRSKAIHDQKSITQIVLPTLIKLFHEENPIREKAPLVLAHLVAENEEYQKAACDADAITILANFIKDTTGDVTPYLREASLFALSAICLLKEECRKQAIESKVVTSIVRCLEDESPAIREAACHSTRALSRSAKNLRTHLVDAGIALPLLNLLTDESNQVKTAACATLCNIVLEFSPMKKIVIENKGVEKLVEMTLSMDSSLRLNAVWALKNLLYQADSQTKESTMEKLTYPSLVNLINDSEIEIQEQALSLLRNLASSKGDQAERDIGNIFQGIGDQLIPLLESKLESSHNDTIEQTLYVIVNLATGSEQHKQTIMNSKKILSKIREFMENEESGIRVASVWCIINLTWKEDQGMESRVTQFQNLGYEDVLKTLLTDNDTDVKDRAKTALEQFELENKMEF